MTINCFLNTGCCQMNVIQTRSDCKKQSFMRQTAPLNISGAVWFYSFVNRKNAHYMNVFWHIYL